VESQAWVAEAGPLGIQSDVLDRHVARKPCVPKETSFSGPPKIS
jgi:hypothetical protein